MIHCKFEVGSGLFEALLAEMRLGLVMLAEPSVAARRLT